MRPNWNVSHQSYGSRDFSHDFFPEVSCLCLPEKLRKKIWKISPDPLNMLPNIGLNTKKLAKIKPPLSYKKIITYSL